MIKITSPPPNPPKSYNPWQSSRHVILKITLFKRKCRSVRVGIFVKRYFENNAKKLTLDCSGLQGCRHIHLFFQLNGFSFCRRSAGCIQYFHHYHIIFERRKIERGDHNFFSDGGCKMGKRIVKRGGAFI